jgi:hypothetical protein
MQIMNPNTGNASLHANAFPGVFHIDEMDVTSLPGKHVWGVPRAGSSNLVGLTPGPALAGF